MNTPESDIDIFSAYIVPTKDILSGVNSGYGSHCSGSADPGKIDKVSHEIGKIVEQLIKGNINYLIGTLSPLITFQHNKWLSELKSIVFEYGQTKACTHSIRGLAVHNYKKYVVGSDTAREYPIIKKCNTINRTLLFGINLLAGNGFKFTPVIKQTPEDVRRMLQKFDYAVIESELPERNNPKPFHDYLLKIRLSELNGTL
jgi:predicted nucleotidyltransferase